MKCEIIIDLLPSYVDELTSKESNIAIKEHLKTCETCKSELDSMKKDIDIEEIEINKEEIKPLKKLNKKIIKSIALTILSGVTLVGSYFYFFGVGWRVDPNDLKMSYYEKDGYICFDFELKNGRVLNAWTDVEKRYTISFTECYSSILDDRGVHPNQFSYGIHYKDENNKVKEFTDKDILRLKLKDKVEEINLKEISEELNLTD